MESFVHTRYSAGFITITSGFEFSVHTGGCRPASQNFADQDLSGDKPNSPSICAKTASSCLAARKRFEQRLGRLCGPIDGVPIAINPQNDEAALHYSYEHQRKLAGVKAFRNFRRRLELRGEPLQRSPGVRGNNVRRASSTRPP